MWRRLCIDVDHDGTILGASVELYDEATVDRRGILVMEPGWSESHTLESVFAALLHDGWVQAPLF